ncbi:sensor domain-containing protein, partial [Actinoplanes sp. NPDC048791]|uniref:sensor domain-containing protein n=1 Tax=Actinoplanes sp. NPDC048791 TaxID=3154623 RepID=UPI00340CB05D
MPVRNALEALTMRPTRFLLSPWPLRSLIYLTGGALIGLATIAATLLLLAAGVVLSVVVVGVAGYLATVLSGVAVGRLERWRMR